MSHMEILMNDASMILCPEHYHAMAVLFRQWGARRRRFQRLRRALLLLGH